MDRTVLGEEGPRYFGISPESWPRFHDVYWAYKSARVGKPSSSHQIRFQQAEGLELISLYQDIKRERYEPSRAVCFVVTHPKPREIWASHFRDRIVHHLIVSRLEPLWERRFSTRSFACRKRMGSHRAVKELCSIVRRVSRGGAREAWVLQLDVASFFVSIDRKTVLDLLLHDPLDLVVRRLIETTFRHDPRNNVWNQATEELRSLIAPGKSWFNRGPMEGLPIGNLTSQFAANVYLNGLDHFIERELRPAGYLRYMDDMTLVDSDPERLRAMIEPIDNWLLRRRSQQLNSDKTTLKAASRSSIDYLGYRLRPDKTNRSKVVYVTVDPKKKWDFVRELRILERAGIPHGIRLHPLWPEYSHRASREAWAAVRSREGHLKHARLVGFVRRSLDKVETSLNSHWVDLGDLEF
jgi:hypothetical protein